MRSMRRILWEKHRAPSNRVGSVRLIVPRDWIGRDLLERLCHANLSDLTETPPCAFFLPGFLLRAGDYIMSMPSMRNMRYC
jgi:hypothetical protein